MELLDDFDVREICPTCKVIVLARSRHCNVCNVCIDRFDHHCQWLNNCVGRRNHPYFLVFVLVQALYLFLVAGTVLATMASLIKGSDESNAGSAFENQCSNGVRHWTEWCFIVDTDFFDNDARSRGVVYTVLVFLFLISFGFAFPVFNLFTLQMGNILTG